MNIRIPLFALFFSLSNRMYGDTAIDLSRFQIQVEKGAQANAEIVDDTEEGQKALVVTVSKPGPEFWSVELRAPGFKFQAPKHYELKFRAKSAPGEYVYFVAEKDSGDQESIALGTTLKIPEQWTECTVDFDVSQNGDPGRLTISDLSVDPSSFRFRDFQLIEK
jgi:Carbohydrate binding domain